MNKILVDKEGIDRILRRISHEIIEKNKGINNLIFFGILRGGYPLAIKLSDNISLFEKKVIPVYFLDITSFRDDIKQEKSGQITNCDLDITDKKLILVDDVISTGRTVRAALDAIKVLGRPSKIELVAIVDRGHRELPIKPDFIGKNIPTSKEELVVVKLTQDGDDSIYITTE